MRIAYMTRDEVNRAFAAHMAAKYKPCIGTASRPRDAWKPTCFAPCARRCDSAARLRSPTTARPS